MKKSHLSAYMICMVLTLAACSGGGATSTQSEDFPENLASEETSSQQSEDFPENMGKCSEPGVTEDIGGVIYICKEINKALILVKDETAMAKNESVKLVLSVPYVNPELAVKFLIFGSTLPSGITNPNPEIYFKGYDTPVFASAPGKVIAVEKTDQDDYAISIMPDAPNLIVIYDHIENVKVEVGQEVEPGYQLGTTGPEFRRDDDRWKLDGFGRAEMMVKDYKKNPSQALCHSQFETPEVSAAFAAAAKRLNGIETVCLVESVQP